MPRHHHHAHAPDPRAEQRRLQLIARLPRGMRPRLTRQQRLHLALAHNTNLDAIQRGQAGDDELWHVVGGVLTWWAVALDLQQLEAELLEQLQLAARLLERRGRTGRVLFTGPDYQTAKAGVMAMDELADMVDQPTAGRAADWSEALANHLASQCPAAGQADTAQAYAHAARSLLRFADPQPQAQP
jgi:hypothetical protein